MIVRFFKRGKKKKLLEKLRQKFGLEKMRFLFIESGEEKIRVFTGSLSKEEIKAINRLTRIDGIGLVFAKQEKGDLRLSLDATVLLREQIKKGFVEISKEDSLKWMNGEDLKIPQTQGLNGFVAIKSGKDFFGSGEIAKNGALYNLIPKERRIPNKKLG